MKLKNKIIISLGIAATLSMWAVGISKVSANTNKKVNFRKLVTSEKKSSNIK